MRRYLSHITAACVLAAFVAAGGYSFVRTADQFSVFADYFRTGNWIATQAYAEHLRLMEAIAAFQAEPSPQARADMMMRFDLFWSRLPLVLQGDEGTKLRSLPGVVPAVQRIVDDLPRLERSLQALDGRNLEDYRATAAIAAAYREPLRHMLQALLNHDGATLSSASIHRQRDELLLAFAAVGLAGAALFVLLARSLRAAERSYEDVRVANADAQLAREQLEDAIESIEEGFVLYDRDERLVIANRTYKAFYPTIADIAVPGTRLEAILRTSAARGQYRDIADVDAWTRERLEQHRRPGKPILQRLSEGRMLRISDHRTRSGGIVSVRTDITDMVEAESLLLKRLAAIEVAPDGIAIVDSAGALQYVNHSLARLYGEVPEAMAGRPWSGLLAASDATLVPRRVAEAIGEGRSFRSAAQAQRHDGTVFPVEVAFSATSDAGLVLALRNVEHELAMQQRQAQLEHQFHQAQKMEAIGRLAGGIAHDFNNILAAIVGYSGFLAEDLPRDSAQAGFAAKIGTAAGHAKQLVQQILAFSRSQEVERVPVDAHDAVEEVAALLRAMLSPTAQLRVRGGARGLRVLANPTQINQVLMNLCVNANDALREGAGEIVLAFDGQVEVPEEFGVSPRDAAAAPAGVALTEARADGLLRAFAGGPPRAARYLRFSVSDDGVGMPRRVMERMFDPFFTTKETGKGTGLGLAAVHGIVLSHGGLIEVESLQGRGTTFRVYFPLAETDQRDMPGDTAQGLPRGHERVLVVDDQELVGSMLAGTLERLGYDVTVTVSPEEALEAIGEDPFAWDVLVSDMRMPKISGPDLARRARARRPDLPIVLCTGFSDGDAEAQARAAGVTAILAKPVDRSLLARALRDALDAAAPTSDKAA